MNMNILKRDVGPISKVWTERELIDEAAYEFEQVCCFTIKSILLILKN